MRTKNRHKNRPPHASLREELAYFAQRDEEWARPEPKHHTRHVLRQTTIHEGFQYVGMRSSERPPSDYVGKTLNTDRDGIPVYRGGRQLKQTASDEVTAKRARMGNATPDGKVKVASW